MASTSESTKHIQPVWSRHDDNCSKSCTRSGVALLLLSAFAISMLPTLDRAEPLNTLVGYISRRNTLNEELTRLRSDPVWKLLKASDPTAETWELGKLDEYQGDAEPVASAEQHSGQSTEVTPKETRSPGTPDERNSGRDSQKAPPPATQLRILQGIAPIPIIIKTLEELSDDDFLFRARSYSYRYNRLIEPWALQLNRNLSKAAAKVDSSKVQEGRQRRADLVSKLVLQQVDNLADFNLPDLAEGERLIKEASFTLPSVGIPLGIASSTQLVEVALLVFSAYFLIWYREAQVSPNFPASGTLFGALARTGYSRFMFSLFIVLPPIAAALVAYRTIWLTYSNVVIAGIVTIIATIIWRDGKLSALAIALPHQDIAGSLGRNET